MNYISLTLTLFPTIPATLDAGAICHFNVANIVHLSRMFVETSHIAEIT